MMLDNTRRLLVALAAVVTIACNSDSGTNPTSAVAGTYSLSTFNGQGLPYTISETDQTGTYTVTYLSPFTLALNSDNTVRIITTTRFTFNGFTETGTDTVSGTWALSGSTVSLNVDGDVVNATFNGSNQLTISSPPDVLIFTK